MQQTITQGNHAVAANVIINRDLRSREKRITIRIPQYDDLLLSILSTGIRAVKHNSSGRVDDSMSA